MMSNQWAYVPKFYRILEQERIWRSSNLIFYFTNRETETQELSPSLSLNTHTYFWVMRWVTAYRKYRSGLRKRKGKWPRARPVAPWSIQVCVAQPQNWGPTSYPCFKNHSWSQISFFLGQNLSKLPNKQRITVWLGPDFPAMLSSWKLPGPHYNEQMTCRQSLGYNPRTEDP